MLEIRVFIPDVLIFLERPKVPSLLLASANGAQTWAGVVPLVLQHALFDAVVVVLGALTTVHFVAMDQLFLASVVRAVGTKAIRGVDHLGASVAHRRLPQCCLIHKIPTLRLRQKLLRLPRSNADEVLLR